MPDQEVDAVRDLIHHAHLARVETHELSARRTDQPADSNEEGQLHLSVQYRQESGALGVRLKAEVLLPAGEASAVVAVEYDLAEDYAPQPRIARMFINEVAVLAAYPYLREAISTVTGKVLGSPLHLPMIQRGDVAVSLDD